MQNEYREPATFDRVHVPRQPHSFSDFSPITSTSRGCINGKQKLKYGFQSFPYFRGLPPILLLGPDEDEINTRMTLQSQWHP